jgi:cytochrome c oxidase subunit 1
MAMTFAGTFAVPRRHWDITFQNAPFDLQFSPTVDLLLGIMAIGGLVAALGGGIYILVTVWSVFFGESIEEGDDVYVDARTPAGDRESAPAGH